jgi:hypothetical protein
MLSRMPHTRVIRTALLCLLIGAPGRLPAQALLTASLQDPDIALLYPMAQKVIVMSEVCLKELPTQSAGVPAALAAWNTRHARPQLDSLIERTAKRRAAMGRSLMRMTGMRLLGADPVAACQNFAVHIGTTEHDLGASDFGALQRARRKLGVAELAANVAAAPEVATAPGMPPSAPAGAPDRRATEPERTGPDQPNIATNAGTGIRSGERAPAMADGQAPLTLSELAAPPGWTRTLTSDGGVTFTIARDDTGSASIIVAAPVPLGGRTIGSALSAWIQTQLSRRLDLTMENAITVGRTVFGQPAAWFDRTPDFHNSNDGLRVVAIGVARRDNTFTPLMLLTKDDRHQYQRVEQLGRWFAQLRLPGADGPQWSPASPPPATAGLQGLWLGTQLINRINLYGGMDLIADRGYLVLAPNGFAYRDIPDAGQVDNLNAARICAEHPTDCGTYRVEPTRIVFEFTTDLGLVETDTADIDLPRKEPVSFNYNGKPMFRVPPVTTPLRLSGEFTSIDGTSSGPNGSIALSRSITFFPDGRYQASRFVGFSSTPGASTGTDNSSVVGYNNSGPNRGTYDIRGYTLTMRPENGPVRVATIVMFDDDRPVTAVIIDDNYYRRSCGVPQIRCRRRGEKFWGLARRKPEQYR